MSKKDTEKWLLQKTYECLRLHGDPTEWIVNWFSGEIIASSGNFRYLGMTPELSKRIKTLAEEIHQKNTHEIICALLDGCAVSTAVAKACEHGGHIGFSRANGTDRRRFMVITSRDDPEITPDTTLRPVCRVLAHLATEVVEKANRERT